MNYSSVLSVNKMVGVLFSYLARVTLVRILIEADIFLFIQT
jgi:hypothetical protein